MTLDPDVAGKARRATARTGLPFKSVINQALRLGIEEVMSPPAAKSYRTKPHPMGLKPGLSYDNIAELLAVAEDEAHG